MNASFQKYIRTGSQNYKMYLDLVKDSSDFLKNNKKIMLFPLLSLIFSGLLIAALVLYIFFIVKNESNKLEPAKNLIDAVTNYASINYNISANILILLASFVYIVMSVFITSFFSLGKMIYLYSKLNGGTPTFKYGLENAAKHINKIPALAIAVSMLELRFFLSFSLRKLLNLPILAIFIALTMVIENMGIFKALKKSDILFKKAMQKMQPIQGPFLPLPFLILWQFIILALLSYFFVSSSTFIFIAIMSILALIPVGIVRANLISISAVALYIYYTTGKTTILKRLKRHLI